MNFSLCVYYDLKYQEIIYNQMKVLKVAKSCLTLCDPMDCSLPSSSVHGILQARILESVAISFSGGSVRLRDRTWVSCIAGGLYHLSRQGRSATCI